MNFPTFFMVFLLFILFFFERVFRSFIFLLFEHFIFLFFVIEFLCLFASFLALFKSFWVRDFWMCFFFRFLKILCVKIATFRSIPFRSILFFNEFINDIHIFTDACRPEPGHLPLKICALLLLERSHSFQVPESPEREGWRILDEHIRFKLWEIGFEQPPNDCWGPWVREDSRSRSARSIISTVWMSTPD